MVPGGILEVFGGILVASAISLLVPGGIVVVSDVIKWFP